jgi:hypothetical protein
MGAKHPNPSQEGTFYISVKEKKSLPAGLLAGNFRLSRLGG